ncbi:hypothetical protein BRAO375_320006 [Bradyrhizobium sp. ORS 375]|nr:hypothetical protein BRAO375_320006 [Bradyrhizobium sp. ORS 375]
MKGLCGLSVSPGERGIETRLAPLSRARYFLVVLEPVVVLRWPGALSECPGPAVVLV